MTSGAFLIQPKSQRGRNHQFDLLRILFATFVLLAHAPEMTDGNRSRELFTRLAHTSMSLGDIGVDGFFLLSGYLIVSSWLHAPEVLDYLRKRVLRIVPGFMVCVVLSTLVVGWLAPGIDHFFRHLHLDRFAARVLFLGFPTVPPVLPGNHYPTVNLSLWTISYEFRCYLLVALLGLCGFVRRRAVWLAITLLLLVVMASPALQSHLTWSKFFLLTGFPDSDFRLVPVYFVGGCFFLFRDRIPFRPVLAVLAAVLLVSACIFSRTLFEPALVVFGGYLMFYGAQIPTNLFAWMERFPDISYGVYLYGWPVQSLWIFYHHGSPWVTFAASVVLCYSLGWISWNLVERPMLTFKRKPTAPLPPP